MPGTCKRVSSGLHYNDEEATVCRLIIRALLDKRIDPASLAIIVFYREQFRLLESFAKNTNVDIHTVDPMQGRENDSAVLLSTKTVSDPEGEDFIDDPRRFSVALTRCRHGQFVLGYEKSLKRLTTGVKSSNELTTAAPRPPRPLYILFSTESENRLGVKGGGVSIHGSGFP
ncbi:hypothetical protein GCK32_001941 [Trichostrongylus colubriformis]|uniref:DNA2/NAM7 helicase-like C-terminal domain-containing protein n=1 Tax=Trichostrongylus colubriformis TaxID=6319 RepID=A0AAN8J1G4_TRICO